MNRITGLLSSFLLVFAMIGISNAAVMTNTQVFAPNVELEIGQSLGFAIQTGPDFQIPYDTINSATMTLVVDDFTKGTQVSVAGTLNALSLLHWTLHPESLLDWDFANTFTISNSIFSGGWPTGNFLTGTITNTGGSLLFNDDLTIDSISVTLCYINGSAPVPEPATLVLMGLGMAGVAFIRRRTRA